MLWMLACLSPGAEEAPTLKLPETAAPTSYQVELKLDPASPKFSGNITIELNIKQPLETLWLNGAKIDVQNAQLTAGGQTYQANASPSGDDFLGLHFNSNVPAGNAELRIAYTGNVRQQDSSGIFMMEDNGNKYLYTQFESTDARAAFPCFDEPSYKVPWQLKVSIPRQYTAISNTPVLHENTGGELKTIQFKQTKPLPVTSLRSPLASSILSPQAQPAGITCRFASSPRKATRTKPSMRLRYRLPS